MTQTLRNLAPRLAPLAAAMALLWAAPRFAPAASSNSRGSADKGQASAASGVSFDSFRIIMDRNIFDPKRRGPQAARPASLPPVKTDHVELIGAIISQEGAFAFFEGSKSEYNATVRVGDMIDDCRVVDIRTDHVTLERKGRQIQLPVGVGLSRQGEGEWKLAAASVPAAGPREDNHAAESRPSDSGRGGYDPRSRSSSNHSKDDRGSSSSSHTSSPDHGTDASRGASAGGGESASDLMKKMMEKRNKEIGK